MTFYEELLINQAIALILATIKNEHSQLKFKSALLKIRNKINEIFPGE